MLDHNLFSLVVFIQIIIYLILLFNFPIAFFQNMIIKMLSKFVNFICYFFSSPITKPKVNGYYFFLMASIGKAFISFYFLPFFLSPFETSHSFFNKQKGFTILVPEKFMFKTQKSADRVRSLTTILPIYKFIIFVLFTSINHFLTKIYLYFL
jgi:hypothetical protein